MSIDLHTHSTYSDGVLTPAELVRRAATRGVHMLALTDHDETGGIAEAQLAAAEAGIRLVAGVEISATWNDLTLHVLGLDIDPQSPHLVEGLATIRALRDTRAVRIAAQLDALGMGGSLAGAQRHARGPGALGRNHFARFLVEQKYVRNTNDAFRLYLGSGRQAYVPPVWPELNAVVEMIHRAQGLAVLAHPDRYSLSPRMMQSLFEAFDQADGDAVEVNAEGRFGSSTQVRLARQFGFALSSGSDFHAPGKGVPDVGDAVEIPGALPAIWQQLRAAA
ncbi:MAG: PHP domain-containing protein [Betaproteobacteria bacterium]